MHERLHAYGTELSLRTAGSNMLSITSSCVQLRADMGITRDSDTTHETLSVTLTNETQTRKYVSTGFRGEVRTLGTTVTLTSKFPKRPKSLLVTHGPLQKRNGAH